MTGTLDDSRSAAGRIIEEARVAIRPKLSQRKAADRAGISDSRWRQLVMGFQAIRGQVVEDDGPADTLARMAQVVGVCPEQLRAAGRPDAADILERLAGRDGEPDPVAQLVAIRDEISGVIEQLRSAAAP